MEDQFHSQLESKFFEYLLARGYSRDSITFEPRLGTNFRPDFAVNDPSIGLRLAYFEVRGLMDDATRNRSLQQLRRYATEAREVGASFYVVTPAKEPTDTEPFDFLFVNDKSELEALPRELFPTYRSLSSDVIATRKVQVETSRERTKDTFQIVCWVIAVVVIVLGIADFVCDQKTIELVDTTRITLLGIAVALIVIPFAQKFKILGVEYERLDKARDRDSKS